MIRTICFTLPVVLLGVDLAAGADNPAKRPNVLLIYTDDHAQWAIGAYGNKEVRTPNMDRLAAEGIRFTQGFTKPVCSPSRAMLLSGQYSHRLGIPDYIPYGQIPYLVDGKEQERFGKSATVASDCTTILAERAIDFIQSNRESPFFLFLSFYRPHLAWTPVPERDFAHYKDRPITVPDPPAGSSVTRKSWSQDDQYAKKLSRVHELFPLPHLGP